MKYLVVGPSALGMFAILGYMKAIEDQLEDLEEISSASSGSFIALAYLANNERSVSRVFDISLELPFNDYARYKLSNFIKNYGFISHDQIRHYITQHISDDTFGQLYEKTKIKFHVSAFCAETGKTEYFSCDTHPAMHVADAVCMSVSIPFLFSAYRYNDNHYIDGGTVESLPLGPFLKYPADDIMCIKMSKELVNVKSGTKIKSLIDYLMCFMRNAIAYSTINYDNIKNVRVIDLDDVDIFNFKGLTYDTKIKLFIRGFQCALSHSGLAK